MTLRIIAGRKRGATLSVPRGLATRPTLGRVRESLFMILMGRLPDARVLDCFAGCGALGLEALSRGAAEAVFVEQARPALAALEANIRKLGWEDRTRVIGRDALAVLRGAHPPGQRPFDLILLDPPYGRDLGHSCLDLLAARAEVWLTAGGLIVAQHDRRDRMDEIYGPLARRRLETYRETRLAFFEVGR